MKEEGYTTLHGISVFKLQHSKDLGTIVLSQAQSSPTHTHLIYMQESSFIYLPPHSLMPVHLVFKVTLLWCTHTHAPACKFALIYKFCLLLLECINPAACWFPPPLFFFFCFSRQMYQIIELSFVWPSLIYLMNSQTIKVYTLCLSDSWFVLSDLQHFFSLHTGKTRLFLIGGQQPERQLKQSVSSATCTPIPTFAMQ